MTYDIADLYHYVDQLADLSSLVYARDHSNFPLGMSSAAEFLYNRFGCEPQV